MEKICSVCGKEMNTGIKMKSLDLCLCENCINLFYKTIHPQKSKDKSHRQLTMTPAEIKEELDKNIIGQEDAKIAISIAVYNHYKRMHIKSEIKLSKSNVLLIGPTGSGKTLIAQTVAELLDVPFAIADCTSLTEAGYVGDDVETILTKLLGAADGDIDKAEKGIIFLDEIDKIASSRVGANLTKDPSGQGVQQALLKLIEGTVANVPVNGRRKNPNEKMVEMNTENILFICGGAFQGLEDIINKRTSNTDKSIGFGANVAKAKEKSLSEAFKEVTTEDLIKYGFIPEFIGRLPVVVTLEELTNEAMVDILTKPKNSLVNQYKEIFKYDGVKLEFTDEALKEIAGETMKRKTGARGLRGIMEEILKEAMFKIPSEPYVKKCIVQKNGKVTLERSNKESTGEITGSITHARGEPRTRLVKE